MDDVLRWCADGVTAEQEGRREDAAACYRRAWEAASDGYHRCVAAHYLARVQDTPQAALAWNLTGLELAEQLPPEQVAGYRPVMLVGAGAAHEALGDEAAAQLAYLRASDVLATMDVAGISDELSRVVADGMHRLGVHQIACVLLVNRTGSVLLQLRDSTAKRHPHHWGLPGGHIEPGETASVAALRELHEETGLRPDGGALTLFARDTMPERALDKHYFCAATGASQQDVVLGEGEAMVFTDVDAMFDGRPYTPGTEHVLAAFVRSPEYARLRNSMR